EDELAETLDARVALDLDAEALFAQPCPVFLEPVGSRHPLDDIGLLRIIGLFLFGRLSFGGRRVLPLLGRLRGLGRDETIELKRRRSEKQGDETCFSETAHGDLSPVTLVQCGEIWSGD